MTDTTYRTADDTVDLDLTERILFTDFEATGLDFEDHTVPLEIAAIVTDGHLNEVATFGPYTIAASEDSLAQMNDFVTAMHTKTGLLEKVRSRQAFTLPVIDAMFTFFISEHFPIKGSVIPAGSVLPTGRTVHTAEKHAGAILGGSSIKYDWNIIRRFLPTTFDSIDYRVIDTSSFREVIRRLDHDVYDHAPKVTPPHQAMADIRLSIDELRWFTRHALFSGFAAADISDTDRY